MAQDFNVDPYYDDFDPTKNFHRILFKPGVAVQARELTQSQTILQDQVTKFADNIFKQNSPVTGGQVTTNFNCFYVKLQTAYNNANIDITQFKDLLVTNVTGTVVARVLAVAAATGTGDAGDPPTLILSYKSGGQFMDNDVIYDVNSNLAAQAIAINSTGLSSVVSISQGVFYVLGNFVQIQPSTIVLDKYTNLPSKRVGLTITETIIDYINDSSLLDPAIGASNYQAPGADRYEIALALDTRPLSFGDDENFIELVRVTNGNVSKLVDGSVYNVIDDYFAKRDYETNGDYVVNDFKLTPKVNPNNADTYIMSVGKGLAYVHGYRVENTSSVDLVSNRARTTSSLNNNPVFIDYGSYLYIDSVAGANGSFFDTTTTQSIDFHCVDLSNVKTSVSNTYNSTRVGTGYIRSLVYDHNTDDTMANTFVYKAYVCDIQNNVASDNVVSATTSTVTFPSYFSSANGAYVGINITITQGTDVSDFRTITNYNGATKTATVNQNWTVTPDTTSIFSLNFDIKDIETLIDVDTTSFPATRYGSARINAEGKVGGVSTGNTLLENPGGPELIFRIGNSYVSNLANTSYTTEQLFRNISFTSTGGGVSAQLNYQGDYINVIRHFGTPLSTISADLVKQNYVVVVTNKGSNSTINVGDVIPWTTIGKTVSLDSTASIATFADTNLTPFTATILAKVFVENADNTGYILKGKNLIKANTSVVSSSNTTVNVNNFVDNNALTSKGQVYIKKAGLVNQGQRQSLYLSDVKQIIKILDTGDANISPTTANLGMYIDVTNNYDFNNGQTDNYYDHASISLRYGRPYPKGNLLVFLDYYQHTGGDGYFSVMSYIHAGVSSLPESYQQIPQYTSKHGTTYALRDCLDFRPTRLNAQTSFVFRYANSGDSKHGTYLPVDLTTFIGDYAYYLARKDKLVLSKDKSFEVIEGAPSLNPLFPSEPDGSLVIANISHNPYTGYVTTEAPTGFVADLSVEKVKHKRYTMQDIAGLENRINQVEYYTSLSLLEQKTQTLQIPDAYGLNRFKNGILVDDFSSYATSDTGNPDFFASINRRDRVMTASQQVKNFPLKSSFIINNMGLVAPTTLTTFDYAINSDGYVNYYSLPYTTANVVTQKFASRTVNVNPFSFSLTQGSIALSPNVDTWVDTNHAPGLLITDPNLQVFQSTGGAMNVLTAGDWKTIPGTQNGTVTTVHSPVEGHNINPSPFGFFGYVQTDTTTYINQSQTNVLGPYSSIGNTYGINNGYITDVSVLPFIRPQQIVIRSKGLLFNSTLNTYFDTKFINNYVRKSNIIELTGVSGTFNEDDVIGYYTSGVFYATGRILGVYNYADPTTVRLYVAADGISTSYTTNSTIQNAFFNTSGTYISSTAEGTLASTNHFGGRITSVPAASKIVLSGLASTANNYYTGNTIYFNAGTGVGQSAYISTYYGANQTAVLTSSVTLSSGDVYSIGSFSSDESGSFYGIFNLPENTFNNGQRVLRVDNSINGNPGSSTTYAEGTFYAEGLQTTQTGLDFGASPSGAKGTFTSTQTKQSAITTSAFSPWDPVAQTFIVDKNNYPNGLFLSSIKAYFASKPTSDNSSVTLSIVGTLNGYPSGDTLDHSIVTLTPDKVKVSSSPQYLDPAAYTQFTFNTPIYIIPGVLYAFILKTNSKEYTLWTASNGDIALSSSTKNLPTDPTPSVITKIASAPYVGALFLSQNSQTWTADQNQDLMFVIDSCIFDTTKTPIIQHVIPKKLPERTLVDQSVQYYLNANNVSSTTDIISNTDVLVDAFNITTTDFLPTTTMIGYTYAATIQTGTVTGQINITPGKYGTPTQDDIYLNDGLGERILLANTSTSFTLFSQLSSTDSAVSPIISDAGTSAYTIKWNINNCELSNSVITLVSGGSGYNVQTTSISIDLPTGKNGTTAFIGANITNGIVQSVYLTSPGSGYIETPKIYIVDANNTPGTGATVKVTGETSSFGGNALAKYVTKKVVLDAGFDSGDLNIYLTAYRPVNTDILVYYKILNRSDTQRFDDGSWQLMNKIKNSDSSYSQTRGDLIEYTFAPGTGGVDQGFVTYTSTNGQTYTTFSQFAIKVVLTTTDHTYTPFLTNLRAIALPPNVNTTF